MSYKILRSGIHHRGVFATKNIKKGTKITEYVGEKLTKAQSDRRADVYLDNAAKDSNNGAVYIFELNKKYDIDGYVPHNDAKYINHACDPNCDIEITRGHIWVVALRNINKGEEITYNYGYDFEDYEDHPCRCGSPNCVGYILDEDHWHKLKEAQST